VSKVAWIADTEGEVALVGGAAKTVLSVVSAAGKVCTVVNFHVDFDGLSAGSDTALVELMRSTQATAGTSSPVTARRKRGPSFATAGFTAAKNFSVEPTVLTLADGGRAIDPNKGQWEIQNPLGREIEIGNGEALVMRINAPQSVNCRAWLEVEEG
jgi:hypothetical protein